MRTLLQLLFVLGTVFTLSLWSCGPTSGPSCQQLCPDGCCDEQGVCRSGESTAACGQWGQPCQVCALSQQCRAGSCVENLAAYDAGTDGGVSADAGVDAGCPPTTCAQLGAQCGTVPDGCGQNLECGNCTAPQTCGGAGLPNRCGVGTCTPKTCLQLNAQCGELSDGCGQTLNCGTCAAPQTCGGGNVPNRCGTPPCTPKTCAQLGADCDSVSDGCGSLLQCGTCSAGQTCGVGGTPNRCGTAPSDCTVTPCPQLGFYCDLATRQCVAGCASNANCVSPNTKCDISARRCVCVPGSCGPGQYCAAQGSCAPGCELDSQCATNQECSPQSNQCQCKPKHHLCSGLCSPDDSPDTCGTRCTPCPAPPDGATATCEQGQCGYRCNPERVICGGGCCRITHFAAGQATTHAVTSGGQARSWGYNGYGVLGDGTQTSSNQMVEVSGQATGTLQVVAGFSHACLLTTSGTVKCWGENQSGQLGPTSLTQSNIPVSVSGLSGVVSLSAGAHHTCALRSTGAVVCWGRDYSGLVTISGLSGVTELSAGSFHTCAIVSGGALKCWGKNTYGALGNGTTTDSAFPVTVSGLSGSAVAVGAGTFHTCAVLQSGAVSCWGACSYGQCGKSQVSSHVLAPHTVSVVTNAVAVGSGEAHSCAVGKSGALWCWGNNDRGQLGRAGSGGATPQQVTGVSSGAAAVALGSSHSCAFIDERLKCWGWGTHGQLGNGVSLDRNQPQTVITR